MKAKLRRLSVAATIILMLVAIPALTACSPCPLLCHL